MACNTNTCNCQNQLLVIDDLVGDLSITNGNSVNLCNTVKLCETKGTFNSLTLTGTILQAVMTLEDGIQQAKNVDLSSLVTGGATIGTETSNSIALYYDGTNLRADLLVDPASTAPVSASSSGVKFDCCPELPITANTTNTIQLTPTGNAGHVLTANIKYQTSPSILFSDSSAGLSAAIKLSTDTGNSLSLGTDGALYNQTAASQLSSLSTNGYITTGPSGTLLIGSDSKLYRIPDPVAEQPITGLNSETVNVTVSGANNHTIQANLNVVTTNTITLTPTLSGLQADLKIDNTTSNIILTSDSSGLVANANAATITGIQNTAATVQNPLVRIFGTLNNNSAGYATVFASQYGVKIPIFTSSQRSSIPIADLYDTLLVFDSTLRQYMWYDVTTNTWQILGSGGGGSPTPPVGSTVKVKGIVDAGGSPFVTGSTYTNGAITGFPVEVYRSKLFEPEGDPGNGDSYFTVSTSTITFSPALTAGELIQVIILPS